MAESFAPLRAITGICAHITVIDGQLTTTTQDIATVYGKDHDKVVRIVRQRMAEAGEWGIANFGDTPYTNPQNGQTYTVIRMTKKGFHFVVGKFTGAKAVAHQIAFADGFERMEAQLSGNSGELPAPPKAMLGSLPVPDGSVHETARRMGGFAAAVGLQVQMTVLDMMAQGKTAKEVDASLQHHRWMAYFDHTGKAHARQIDPQARVMTNAELCQAIRSGGVSTPDLLEIAEHANMRLRPDTMMLKKADVINLMANITADVWTEMKQKMDKRQGVAA